MKDYTVTRAHLGDKPYARGDTRTADPRKVKHLVDKGVLVEPDAEAEEAAKREAEEAAKREAEEAAKGGKKAAPAAADKGAPEGGNKAAPAAADKGSKD